ncbi:hypothetical protein ES703_64401 [subsurface metagenome]
MPDPQDFRFHQLTPKGPPMEVGERLERRLTPDAELRLRIQCIERVISYSPFAWWYASELKSVGLKKLDMRETAFHHRAN